MRETWAEMRARSKKWPYPNYIIIPAAGSLFSRSFPPASETRGDVDATLQRIINDRGVRRSVQE